MANLSKSRDEHHASQSHCAPECAMKNQQMDPISYDDGDDDDDDLDEPRYKCRFVAGEFKTNNEAHLDRQLTLQHGDKSHPLCLRLPNRRVNHGTNRQASLNLIYFVT